MTTSSRGRFLLAYYCLVLFSEWRVEGTVQSYTVYIYINIDI